MNCKHCGEKIAVFSRYCENCGQETYSLLEWMKIIGCSIWAFIKKRWRLTAIAGGALIFAVVLVILLCRPKYINPLDYIITNAYGYDGSGRISVSIDYDTLCEDILGKQPDTSTKKGYEQNAQYQENVAKIKTSLYTQTDRAENLSNKDFYIVTVYVFEKQLYDDLGVAFKRDEYQKTFQVGTDTKAFDAPITIDLFDYITPVFTGTNGMGKLSFIELTKEFTLTFSSGKTLEAIIRCYKRSESYYIAVTIPEINISATIEMSPNTYYNYHNGDEIQILLASRYAEETLAASGILIASSQKTYIVTNLE